MALASELIETMSGKFEPQKMPDEYTAAVEKLVKAKVKGKAPEVTVAAERKEPTKVINIMAALKEMDKRRAKVGSAVKRRTGKEDKPTAVKRLSPSTRRTVH